MIGRHRKEGTVFDLAVLAANIWLVPRLAGLAGSGGRGEAVFGALLLLSLPAYCLGAWLKRGPLGERLKGSKPPFGILVVLFILLVMQYGYFIAILEFGWTRLGGPAESGIFMVVAILAAGFPPALTVRALFPTRQGSTGIPARAENSPNRNTGKNACATSAAAPFGEPLADLALGFSAVISLAWWEGIFVESLARDGGWGPAAAVLLTVLLSVPFAIFYLSPRILLLAEDYRRPATWARTAAVMLPLTARLMG
jgi:hypothetical protein